MTKKKQEQDKSIRFYLIIMVIGVTFGIIINYGLDYLNFTTAQRLFAAGLVAGSFFYGYFSVPLWKFIYKHIT